MSTVKSKKLQVGTDASASNNFTIYQPATPDGTLRIGVGNADSPTEVGRFDSNGYVATNAPAFSAKLGTNQSFSSSTFTKIQYNTEDFDTNSNYDNATNYRFTPTVAGYYQVNASVRFNYTGSAGDNIQIHIYKNNSHWDCQARLNSTGNYGNISISSLVYCNGSTDYIEIYGYSTHGSSLFDVSANNPSRFSAHLVKAV